MKKNFQFSTKRIRKKNDKQKYLKKKLEKILTQNTKKSTKTFEKIRLKIVFDKK